MIFVQLVQKDFQVHFDVLEDEVDFLGLEEHVDEFDDVFVVEFVEEDDFSKSRARNPLVFVV